MSEIQSEAKKGEFMSALDEASQLVRAIGGDAGSRKEQRLRAWRKLSAHFSWNRIVDLHRGEPRARPTGDELSILRRTAPGKYEANYVEHTAYREIVERIARLEALLLSDDQKVHRNEAAGLRPAADGLGSERRAVDR